MRTQQGLALVIVLWVVMLLSVMAASFAYTMRTETTLVTHTAEQTRGRALAEAGVAYAAYRLLIQPDPENPWPIDGTPREWRFGTGTARIAAVDASGRIDINNAERELFKGLLVKVGGMDEAEADGMLDRIEDYRDPDDLERSEGAEREDYLRAGYVTGPKNAPFESTDELQQVLGMSRELYGRIADAITVASRQRGIYPEAASAKVLRAVPGLDEAAIEDFIQQRQERREQNLPPPELPLGGDYLTASGGLAYHIEVVAELDNGTKSTVTAVISGRQQAREAFHVDTWREGRQASEQFRETLESQQ